MRSIINEVMEAVIGMMNELKLFATVTRGALPTAPGITCEIGPSQVQTVHMDKKTVVPLDVTLNAKHPDLSVLSDTLDAIHTALTRATAYPASGNRWQIIDITNGTLPQVIGREHNNEWLMASSLIVKFYWEGEY